MVLLEKKLMVYNGILMETIGSYVMVSIAYFIIFSRVYLCSFREVICFLNLMTVTWILNKTLLTLDCKHYIKFTSQLNYRWWKDVVVIPALSHVYNARSCHLVASNESF